MKLAYYLSLSLIQHLRNYIFLRLTSESWIQLAEILSCEVRSITSLQLCSISFIWCWALLRKNLCLFSDYAIFDYKVISIMEEPIPPKELFKALLAANYSEIQCIESGTEAQDTAMRMQKQKLKREFTVMQKNKLQYVALLERKQKLVSTLEELLNRRKSMEFDHNSKENKFEHPNYPYRSHLQIKEQLSQQRIGNMEKRRKIRQLEEEIVKLEKGVKDRRREREGMQNVRSSWSRRDGDSDDSFWLKRMAKMRNVFLSKQKQCQRAKIKHDYNLMVQRSSCDCVGRKVCVICSNINRFQSNNKSSGGYAREALLSPRYQSIYRQRGVW